MKNLVSTGHHADVDGLDWRGDGQLKILRETVSQT